MTGVQTCALPISKRFAELERQNGPYSFGKFAKLMMPSPDEYANWEKDSGGIPESIRQRLTEIISTNLRSAAPLPVVLKVGENVDATHDLIVRTFAHNGRHLHGHSHALPEYVAEMIGFRSRALLAPYLEA